MSNDFYRGFATAMQVVLLIVLFFRLMNRRMKR